MLKQTDRPYLFKLNQNRNKSFNLANAARRSGSKCVFISSRDGSRNVGGTLTRNASFHILFISTYY